MGLFELTCHPESRCVRDLLFFKILWGCTTCGDYGFSTGFSLGVSAGANATS
jgi:hypothetical protein